MSVRYERLNAQQFHSRWQEAQESDKGCYVVDVRSPHEFAGGHVPGAKLMPLDRIHEVSGELDRAEPVYLICRSGMRSQMAAKILAGQGFAHLINVDGGTVAWIQAGYQIER